MYRLWLDEGKRAVINRVINALMRALLVAILVALPSLATPDMSLGGAQIALFSCLLAALFTFVEYFSRYPSIVEFRDAAPFNRMRFFMAFMIVALLTVLYFGSDTSNRVAGIVHASASVIGNALDFPLSPVRLALISMPNDASLELLFMLRDGAALAYAISLVGVGAFYILVRVYDWPARNGAFNVWVNLPLFDPTTGGDVVPRLRRDGYVNLIGGALLPFVLPALAAVGSSVLDVASFFDGQSFVWSIVAWSFIPASMMMRGIAMCRIAELIEAKRARAYASAAANALG
ncbi:hypothetical protein ACS3SW_12090 [Roseobacteraceae bacterium S113]